MRHALTLSAFAAITIILQSADAIVFGGRQDWVLDYEDINADFGLYRKYDKMYVYGTGSVDNTVGEEYLKNVVIREASTDTQHGKLAITLLDLVTEYTNQTTGLKRPFELAANQNYIIRNENPASTGGKQPFYIYITKYASEVSIYDANYASKITATGTALLMSPFLCLQLHSFDLGKAAYVSVSVAPPQTSGQMLLVTPEKPTTANASIATVFGPIATLTTDQPNSAFSFRSSTPKDVRPALTTIFKPNATLGLSNPGYAGGLRQHYAHPLRGQDLVVRFNTANHSEFNYHGSMSFVGTDDIAFTTYKPDNKQDRQWYNETVTALYPGTEATGIELRIGSGRVGKLTLKLETGSAGENVGCNHQHNTEDFRRQHRKQ